MSKYYGTLIGSARTIATRQGTAKTGIRARLQTKSENVEIEIKEDENGDDILHLVIRSHNSKKSQVFDENLTKLTNSWRKKE